ncbi:FAD-dependent oxidoreductase [Mycena sanguinolenta]|uniref:FAD-dependent oxidoreductase n=1 Tax=Mycena sanguinolenta TaxID=230812 RepID=A0A8H6ZIT3_9AGAR|nr:FAD-dependent oxidoreductase [Mycena sanguinolenta]
MYSSQIQGKQMAPFLMSSLGRSVILAVITCCYSVPSRFALFRLRVALELLGSALSRFRVALAPTPRSQTMLLTVLLSLLPFVVGETCPQSAFSSYETPVKPRVKGGEAFPTQNGMSLSHWLQSVRSNPLLDYRSTPELPEYAEVVIIGGGFTGALTAYELLSGPNPPSSVVIIEARELSSGASGRNEGHCRPDLFRGFNQTAPYFGEQAAKELVDHAYAGCDQLIEFVQKHKVDCEFWTGETLEIARDQEPADEVAAVYKHYKSLFPDDNHITRYINDTTEAEKFSRIKGAKAVWGLQGIESSSLETRFVHFTFFARELIVLSVSYIISLGLAKGLNLQTWTTAYSVTANSHADGLWDVNTSRGVITAPTVVYATNAYTSGILPSFAPFIQPETFLCQKHSFDVRIEGHTFLGVNARLNGDGNMVAGGVHLAQKAMDEYLWADTRRLYDDSLGNFEPVTEAIIKMINNSFIGWNDVPHGPGVGLQLSWSGILARSADYQPFIGKVPGHPGQWISAGYHGLGIPHVFPAAKGLATLIQGGTWADTGLPSVLELTHERLEKALRDPQF